MAAPPGRRADGAELPPVLHRIRDLPARHVDVDGGGGLLQFVPDIPAGGYQHVLQTVFAGAVADRLGRRRMMLAADVLRCGAQACLAAALFAGRPAIWLFVLLAWLGGSGQAFFSPALSALTVEIAPSDQLGNANALYGLATRWPGSPARR